MTVKRFDLEQRTLEFTQAIIQLGNQLPRSLANLECAKQMIRSAGSIGANYIEANEALGPKDFIMRIRISRTEAQEVADWLQVLIATNPGLRHQSQPFLDEAIELKKILSAVILKTEKKNTTK